ncbi:siderophore-interacting protein [soil metagenome]
MGCVSDSSDDDRTLPTRREPPAFRRVAVRRITELSPHMRRIVLGGDELDGLEIDEPAASVRMLLPPAGEDALVMPTWSGNQFDLPDGRRAPIRTFTPRHMDPERQELTLDVVLHGEGAASEWARAASPGDEVAISGPGRGYEIDTGARSYLLVGDEVAIPAISQLLEALPETMPVAVEIEVSAPSARVDLPDHPAVVVTWHERADGAEPGDALVAVVRSLDAVPDRVWVAGEAAAVQRIRKHLFDERGLSRSDATVRGYWQKGRSAT